MNSICSAVTQTIKIPMWVGGVPTNVLLQHRDSRGATRQRARDILVQLLESLGNGAKWSWQLFYDPSAGLEIYMLNIHQVLKRE